MDQVYARMLDVPAIIRAAWQCDVPVLLVGAPGIGKTDTFDATATDYDADLIVSHPVVEDPTYSTGLPWPNGDREVTFRPFGALKRVLQSTAERIVWVLDDIGQAPASVQASYMSAILNKRTASGDPLPSGLRWGLATNRRTDRAGVQGILAPIISRCMVVHVETTIEDWVPWAMANDIDPRIVGYLRAVPGALNESTDADMQAYACPRTWARASRVLALALDDRLRNVALAGLIGPARASEFASFLSLADSGLPSWDEMIDAPTRAKVPSRPDLLYAVASMIAQRCDAASFEAVYPYMKRLPVEYQTVVIHDAYSRCKPIGSTRAFVDFTSKHPQVFGL